MLAPRQRAFIYIGQPAHPSSPYGPPFLQGYGETDVDWTLLTYYRYERVVQDLIEDAHHVLRGDLSEEAKAGAVRAFRASLEGGNFDAAHVAAAQIPEDPSVEGLGRGGGGPTP